MLGNLFQPTYEVNMVTKSRGMVMRRMREEGDGNCDVDIMLFSTMIAITIYTLQSATSQMWQLYPSAERESSFDTVVNSYTVIL